MEYNITQALRAVTQTDRRVLMDAYISLRDFVVTHSLLKDQERRSESWRQPFLKIGEDGNLSESSDTFTGRSPFQGGTSDEDMFSLIRSFASNHVALPPMGWLSQAFSMLHFRILHEFLTDFDNRKTPLLVTSTKRQLSRSDYVNDKIRRSAHAYGWAMDVHFINPMKSLSQLYADSALLTPFAILTQENIARYSVSKSTSLNSMVYALSIALVNSFPSAILSDQTIASAFVERRWDDGAKSALRRHLSSLLSSPRGTSVSWMFGQLESSPRTTWLHVEALIPWSRGISKHYTSISTAGNDCVIDTMSCNTAWMQIASNKGVKGTREVRWNHKPIEPLIQKIVNQA